MSTKKDLSFGARENGLGSTRWHELEIVFYNARQRAGALRNGIHLADSICVPLPDDASEKVQIGRNQDGRLILGIRSDALETEIEGALHIYLSLADFARLEELTPGTVRAMADDQITSLHSKPENHLCDALGLIPEPVDLEGIARIIDATATLIASRIAAQSSQQLDREMLFFGK